VAPARGPLRLGHRRPFALLCGILGLRSIRRNPGLGGKGRAWFGLVMGAVFSLSLLSLLIASLFKS
jgi:hypothetical protein